MRTGFEGSIPVITSITPVEADPGLVNRLVSSGRTDSGYVFAAPYGTSGWIEGSVPSGDDDFVLKASIGDPPLLLAKILNARLNLAGITVRGGSSTRRLEGVTKTIEPVVILLTTSPPLSEIIKVLNHESVNLFAEHLVKEMGKVFENKGSTNSGIKTINRFLADSAGIGSGGIILADGSGLSPSDAIDSRDLAKLLLYMKNHGKSFELFYSSLPEAGKGGTLKSRFTDPVFSSALRAKSGSMTRVRSYAGYLTCRSGKQVVFSIIVNNYDGTSAKIVNAIENILKETAIQN
jgi:D-alanyl-D-alanine carboxypeptidase/D-alanyl-D-alanine-endopeptidase (penicillin-binding protein 4)